MRTTTSSQVRFTTPHRLGMALLASGLGLLSLAPPAHAAPPQTGVSCTSSASPNPTFSLDAKPGYIQLPDSNTMYMWSYANASAGGAFQYPGPVLCVNQGDTVTVVLHNSLPEDVSIMFPGQQGVLANGGPAQPQGDGAALTSLTNVATANGGSMTYSFVAGAPGTYVYESGSNPQKQVRMGLFGALIVQPALAAHVNNRPDSEFMPDENFMVLLSEIDPYLNQAAEAGLPFDLTQYQARYWLINGRGFPDSISDNNALFLPDQPYGALARIHPMNATNHTHPGAVRYLNVGTEEFPFHPHGNNGRVIGRDGSPLQTAAANLLANPTVGDLSFEKFAVNIGPGQTWDVLFSWVDAENYSASANQATNEANFPVVIPQVNNQEFGMFYSGSPFLGFTGTLPPGASTLNTCGEYYVISHNHALYQITSWGVNLTGPITYVRVDPPTPNTCAP